MAFDLSFLPKRLQASAKAATCAIGLVAAGWAANDRINKVITRIDQVEAALTTQIVAQGFQTALKSQEYSMRLANIEDRCCPK